MYVTYIYINMCDNKSLLIMSRYYCSLFTHIALCVYMVLFIQVLPFQIEKKTHMLEYIYLFKIHNDCIIST